MITTVLFDLDGTLLPMDNDAFVMGYFKLLSAKLIPLGYDPKALVDGIWAGTAAMVKNDGSMLNEDAFWKKFSSLFGEKCLEDKPIFEQFYAVEFQQAQSFCGFSPKSRELIDMLKASGKCVALATNPVFPAIATKSRIRWAGLAPEDFALFTTYENSRFCKPNLDYYREILSKLGCSANECMMVGNDVEEDMVAKQLGMRVFLLTDCLLNRANRDIASYPHGGFEELAQTLKAL